MRDDTRTVRPSINERAPRNLAISPVLNFDSSYHSSSMRLALRSGLFSVSGAARNEYESSFFHRRDLRLLATRKTLLQSTAIARNITVHGIYSSLPSGSTVIGVFKRALFSESKMRRLSCSRELRSLRARYLRMPSSRPDVRGGGIEYRPQTRPRPLLECSDRIGVLPPRKRYWGELITI